MGEGKKRNAACWCGSGKKLKKCHLNRQDQAPIPSWQAEAQLRDSFSASTCLAPEVLGPGHGGRIVRAHTVSRSGSLERIARAGHVYSFVPSFKSLTENNGLIVPTLCGIRKASTFTGFCATHDDSIFAPIEKAPFDGTPQHCFLVAYRGLVREVFTKSSQVAHLLRSRDLDRGKSPSAQADIQQFISDQQTGAEWGLRDVSVHKKKYDDILIAGDFRKVRAYVVELEAPPPVMAGGSLFPEHDFDGREAQAFGPHLPKLLNHASFVGGDRGVIVFQWLDDSDEACIQFTRSLHRLAEPALGDAIVRFLFEYCENLHIDPDWWESLGEPTRSALVQRMTNSCRPWQARSQQCLMPDGISVPYPRVLSRRGLGFEP